LDGSPRSVPAGIRAIAHALARMGDAALGLLRLFAAISLYSILQPPL
jgi:hypothetical protein